MLIILILVRIMLVLSRHSYADYIFYLFNIAFIRLAFYRLSFTYINFKLSLSLCLCLSLSAHDDISCLHVLLLTMRGTLRNTSKTVTHHCMHSCFMVLLINVLYDGYLIHACFWHTSFGCLFLLNCILVSIIIAAMTSHCMVTDYLRRHATMHA